MQDDEQDDEDRVLDGSQSENDSGFLVEDGYLSEDEGVQLADLEDSDLEVEGELHFLPRMVPDICTVLCKVASADGHKLAAKRCGKCISDSEYIWSPKYTSSCCSKVSTHDGQSGFVAEFHVIQGYLFLLDMSRSDESLETLRVDSVECNSCHHHHRGRCRCML